MRSSESVDNLRLIAFGNGTFVVPFADNSVLTSPDGVTWARHNGGPFSGWAGALTFANGRFVFVGEQLLTSTDGVNWTDRGAGWYSTSIAYGNGMLVSIGPGIAPNTVATIFSSPDGLDWIRRTDPDGYPLYGVAFGAGLFVAVGPSRLSALSTNGINWSNGAYSGGDSVAFGSGLFVATRYGYASNNIATSPDGLTWTVRNSGVAADLWNITFADGIFVATGQENYPNSGAGVLLTSLDGVQWTRRGIPTGANFPYAFGKTAYGAGTFVIVDNAGLILQSDPILPNLTGRATGGAFELTVTGGAVRSHRLQGTRDLTLPAWIDLLTFTNVASATTWLDTENFTQRFYRVVSP